MLKHVHVNKKKVPVPVPIKTLDEAIAWVEQVLVPDGHTITRITLDGRVIGQEGPSHKIALGPESRLEIQIDSPVDLAVQTLEAVRNLASVIGGGLKPLAVNCWQAKPIDKPRGLDAVVNDCALILELTQHLEGLLEPASVETAGVFALARLLDRDSMSLKMAISQSDWRGAARILLNRLEPVLADLNSEAEALQEKVLTLGACEPFAKAGSQ